VYTLPAPNGGKSKGKLESISADDYWLAEIKDIRMKQKDV
jgi:hypothetical protein